MTLGTSALKTSKIPPRIFILTTPIFSCFYVDSQPFDVSDFLFLILEQNDKKVGVERFKTTVSRLGSTK